MFKRILIPLDGSRFSGQALPYASDIAKRYQAKLIMVRAVPPTTVLPSSTASEIGVDPTAARIAVQSARIQDRIHIMRARKYLQQKLRAIKKQGIEGTYHIAMGEPGKSIVRYSAEKRVDLIVMMTSGKGGLKRAILGSVADEVTRKAGVPVLLVPKKRRRRRRPKGS
ncbi:MAG TPA: universal stress protein [Dehalococcoidia bacterium]|nr:universal stress protein [Dehalococcoidia bacterium]